MTRDLPTLRKHEAALGEAMSSNRLYMRKLDDADERAYWQAQQDALDYALAHLREEIAKAEVCPHCINGRLGKYACQHCHGTGRRPTEVT